MLGDRWSNNSGVVGSFTGDGGTDYNDSIYAMLVSLSKYTVDGDGDFATGRVLPSNTSLVDIIGNFTGAYNGTVPDDNIKAALDHLSKYLVDGTGDWASGTALPANKSIYDVLGAYTADAGADDEDTVMAHLDLIYADTAVIDVAALRVATKTVTDWTAAAQPLFTITGGPIRVIGIIGTILVTIKGTTMNLSVVATVTTPSASVDIASLLDCNGDLAGGIYQLNATFGSALVATPAGIIGATGGEFIMPIGGINMTSGAVEDSGGSIRWDILYQKLHASSALAVA